jgi:hypothetical protein
MGVVQRTFRILNHAPVLLNVGAPSMGGTDAEDFTFSSLPDTAVWPWSPVGFGISFDPSAAGVRTATVSIPSNDSDENPFTFAIQGTGLVPEINILDNDMRLDHSSLIDFGGAAVSGGTVQRTLTISNTGDAFLNVDVPSVSGPDAGDFTLDRLPASRVEASSTTSFEITFNPSAAGACIASLSIGNSDNEQNPFVLGLRGTGLLPEIEVLDNGAVLDNHDSIQYGSTAVEGGTIQHTFTISNTGDAVLNVHTPSLTGLHPDDFTLSSEPASSVEAGSSTTFQITFDPSAAGRRQVIVFIRNDDSDESSFTFSISGWGTDTGGEPEIDVQGNGVSINVGDMNPGLTEHANFGSAVIDGGTVQRTFAIHNTGSAVLTIGAPSLDGENAGDFTVTNAPASSVTEGNSTTFQITFDPSAAGVRTAIVNITNSDNDENPFTFAIQGIGFDAQVALGLYLPEVCK